MKTAVHMGAGNIGRGFIGMLLARAGYRVVFADVQEEVVNALKEQQKYVVEVVGEHKVVEEITNVTGVNSNSPEAVDEIASAELVTTAVGPNILRFIAPAIAKAILKGKENGRTSPLHVIACENAVRATSQLKEYVMAELDGNCPEWVSFVDAAVDRIVPPMEKTDDILRVRVEEFSEWLVEKSAFIGEIPAIAGMTPVDNLEAGVERKLFTLNTGHALCAWVGQFKGYKTIGEAIADESIRSFVKAAMEQSGAALVRKHGFDADSHAAYIEKILGRFANPFIVDDVERVGRQPVRKLSKGERIESPVSAALSYGLPVDKLLTGAAAAFYFSSAEDPQVTELKTLVDKEGVAGAFRLMSGLDQAAEEVADYYNNLKEII